MPTQKFSCSDLNSKNNIIEKNIILNKYCSPEKKLLFAKYLNCRYYKKGEIVFYEGQPSYLLYFIYKGVIKLWKEGLHREEQIIRFAGEGEVLGFWGCLGNKNYSLSATVMIDTNICYIKNEDFLKIFENNYEIKFHFLYEYTLKLKKIEMDLRNMAEMNVREKVAKSILILSEYFGKDTNEKSLRIVLSRYEIASLAGINMDSVSKQIAMFKSEKIIIKDKKNVSVDYKTLKNIVRPYVFLDKRNGSQP